MATMSADTTSASIRREIAFQGIRVGLDELGKSFPNLVKEMSGLAKAIMHPVEETRPEDVDADDSKQQEDRSRKGLRKPVKKTSTKILSKKRSREDDDGVEDDVRHQPRLRLIPAQNNSSEGAASTSTSSERPREAIDSDDNSNYRRSKRLRKDAKGKGRESDTYASNHPEQLGPSILDTEATMQPPEPDNAASGSMPRHGSDAGTFEDALEKDIDEPEEIQIGSTWPPTSSCRSDPLPPRAR